MLMEYYLLRNKGVFPVPAFKATNWDNTFEKDPGDCQEAKVLTFSKNAKSIFSKDKSTLCSFLRRILIIVLKRDVSALSLNEPGFGIVSMKHLPAKPSEPWLDQDCVTVMKALRGLKDFGPSPSSRIVKTPKPYPTAKEGSSQSGWLQKQPKGRAEMLRS
ncbi:hypothetical protein SESBI_31803 [Sesbania bispinosa]|nr:hypothetical protein SESBI_31803 [Sesbania bispinosa]